MRLFFLSILGSQQMRKGILIAVLLGFAIPAVADIVVLKNGLVFDGVPTDKGEKIELATAAATLTLDKKQIDRVAKDLREFLKRANEARDEAGKLYTEAALVTT